MLKPVYSRKFRNFRGDMGRQGLLRFLTKSLNVINLAGFLIAHFETSLVFGGQG